MNRGKLTQSSSTLQYNGLNNGSENYQLNATGPTTISIQPNLSKETFDFIQEV